MEKFKIHPVQYTVTDRTLCIKPYGDLDDHMAGIIRERADTIIRDCKIELLVFDFEKTDFMDSAGLGLIMGRFRRLMHHGRKMKAVNVKPVVGKILRYSGIYQIMDIYEI
jgi:stage II sporulation protein AA (anti-sigma F factor antagonist)